MTIDDLRKYPILKNAIISLKMTKESLYYNIQSPPFSSGPHSTTPGDPTKKTVEKIMELDRKIADKQDELEDLRDEIINWVILIPDNEVRAIVNFHYLNGMTWRETTKTLYKYGDSDACKKKIYRYFKEQKK